MVSNRYIDDRICRQPRRMAPDFYPIAHRPLARCGSRYLRWHRSPVADFSVAEKSPRRGENLGYLRRNTLASRSHWVHRTFWWRRFSKAAIESRVCTASAPEVNCVFSRKDEEKHFAWKTAASQLQPVPPLQKNKTEFQRRSVSTVGR